MNDVEPRLARLGTAGQMLGISESAVRRLIRQGELRAVKLTADLRVPVAEIDALIARKLEEPRGHQPAGDAAPEGQP
jgi:excisionase family DNA binding protein